MDLFGFKSTVLLLTGLLLAVYLNYPAPSTISRHLSSWENGAAKYKVINKHKIFYKDEFGTKSDGPVLICLHGFPTSTYDWLKVWPALLDKFSRVIAPDFIGFGFSDKPYDHQYSIMEQADIVENLLYILKVKEVHLLAHDYGDTVAQEVLARFEDRKTAKTKGLVINSLCLLNGGMFPETNFPRPMQKLLLVPYLGSILNRLTNIHVFKRGFGEVFGPETQPTSEEFEDFWALIRKNGGNLIMGKLLQYIPERSANKNRWTGVLQNTNVPVHTIYGPADPVNPPGFVDFFKKTVPGAGVSVLAGHIGHYPQWEDPSGTMVAYFNFLKTLPYPKKKTSTEEKPSAKAPTKTAEPKRDPVPDVDKDRKAKETTQENLNRKKKEPAPAPASPKQEAKAANAQAAKAPTKAAEPKRDPVQDVDKDRKAKETTQENLNRKKKEPAPASAGRKQEAKAANAQKPKPETKIDNKEHKVKDDKPPKRSQTKKLKTKEKQGDGDFIEMDFKRMDKEL